MKLIVIVHPCVEDVTKSQGYHILLDLSSPENWVTLTVPGLLNQGTFSLQHLFFFFSSSLVHCLFSDGMSSPFP